MSKIESDPRQETNEKPEDALSRLIAEQGVRPIDDLNQLADLWPAADDPDALMNFVRSERQARVQPEDERSKRARRQTFTRRESIE
jgi:hypothetical protein